MATYHLVLTYNPQLHQGILGCHIIGPEASILIQEIVNAMNTENRSYVPIARAMHIHPAMPEVVQQAFGNLRPA